MPPTEPSKRQRVSVACQACRAKRMRCDGKEPVCEACTKKGIECVYKHEENKRRPPSKKYVEALQARIRHLESQLVSSGNPLALSFLSGNANDNFYGGRDEEESVDDGQENERDPLTELTSSVGRLAVVDDGQLHYFGSQSSLNLPREPARYDAARFSRLKMETEGLAASRQLGLLINVSPELQEHLLDLYWKWQNPWNYIVHKGAFLKSLRGQDDGRYCSPLLLSAIFAISARYSDRVELRSVTNDPNTAGNAFCEQAKILLLYESETPSVTTIQAAAILALRIMSDGKEALGWLYCGNATRMAYNLGLHMDCTAWVSSGLISEDEAEVRKVTWWGCFVVDKLFSCGLGRPSSVQKSSITCPKPTINRDDEYSPWYARTSDTDQPISLGAHSHIASTAHYVSECMAIACEALELIYAPNGRLSRSNIEDIVGKADVSLRAYYTALPTYLRLPASPKTPSLPHIYLSHIQYHTHLILLHRPLIKKKTQRRFSNVSAGPNATEPETAHVDQHMETCRHSAAEVSKMLRIYKQHYTLRQMPIAGVHLSFAAAVIHLIDARPSNPNRNWAIRRLETCIDTLRDLRMAWCAWADRSLRGIQLMSGDWYGCETSRLQHCTSEGSANDETSPPSVGAEELPPINFTTDHQFGDPCAFLFDDSMSSEQDTENVREWLVESGYDLWSATFALQESSTTLF